MTNFFTHDFTKSGQNNDKFITKKHNIKINFE